MRPRMAVGGCQLAGRNTTRTTHPRHPISILYLAVASIPVPGTARDSEWQFCSDATVEFSALSLPPSSERRR